MTQADRKAWLDGLKVGDEVMVDRGLHYSATRYAKARVEKRTPTGRLVVDGDQYRDGRFRLGRFHESRVLCPVDQAKLDESERSELSGRLSGAHADQWLRLSLDRLRAIAAELDTAVD